jgi:hypothetical protein
MPNVTPYVLPMPRARRTPDLGALTTLVPPELVDSGLANSNVRTKRIRRLPVRQVVYLVLAMSLFPSVAYDELQQKIEGAWEIPGPGPWRKVSDSAVSRARERVPAKVFQDLFFALAAPQAGSPDGRWHGFRLAAIDGTSMEMPGTSLNEAAFGGPVGENGRRVGYPQLRLVALVDCQTRVGLAAEFDRFNRGESRIAAQLTGKIQKGMLVLADRLFVGVELLTMMHQAGGEVLWRVKRGVATRPIKDGVLKDGTYLAQLRASNSHHGRGWMTGKRPKPVTVRIIEYKLNGKLHRLLTSLLDPHQAPARELILLYSQRWQIETFFRECKGDEQGRRRVLRSRTPNGVQQEIWACLIIHLLARWLAGEVVDYSQLDDPKGISFKHAVDFIKEHLCPKMRLTLQLLLGWAVGALTETTSRVRRSLEQRNYPRRLKHRPTRYLARGTPAAAIPFDPASIVLCIRPCPLAA